MVDSMDDFYNRLGNSAALGDEPIEGCGCDVAGAELGASTASVDAALVLGKVVSQYVTLSAQGEALRQIVGAGVQVPCEVWTAYNSARQEYTEKSQALFAQLRAKTVTVEQVVYVGGRPKLDPSDASRVVTLRLKAPLLPPAFAGADQQCPGTLNAGLRGSLGWESIPVQLAAVPSAALSALKTTSDPSTLLLLSRGVLLGLANYGSYKSIKQVAVLWTDYASLLQPVMAYTSCVQAALAANVVAKDVPKRCSASGASLGESSTTLSPWQWLGVGAAVLIVGGLLWRALNMASPAPPLSGPRRVSRRKRRAQVSADPILMGDLYLHPRGQ